MAMRIPALLAALLLVSAGTAASDADLASTDPVSNVPVNAEQTLATQRDAADERYLRLMAEGRNSEAIAAGEELLALTRQLHGEGSLQLASPLTNLATAQLRNGDLRDAGANYQAAIDLLVMRDGFLSPRLANPLVGLGETYLRNEQYLLATETYERALRVNHVNEGFYNLEQIKIRDGLTESYLGQQNLEKANFHQEAEIYVQQRKLGKDNPEFVPALNKLGRWYDRTRQTESARFVYQSAARLVEKTEGENSPALVDPLLSIAETYRQQALLPASPESTQSAETLLPMSSMMLRKALAIVEREEPPDPVQRARILVGLGDLYMMWDKRNTASDRYLEAWQVLSVDPALEGQRDEYFSQPVRIMGPVAPAIYPPLSSKGAPPALEDLEPGFVVVRFNVDQLGRVSDAVVIEADPANLLEERVTRAASYALFRPRYVDGAPVATSGLILRHQFRYAPKKLDQEEATPAEEDSKPLEQPTAGRG